MSFLACNNFGKGSIFLASLSSLQDMICAIVELESDRQIFASRYDKKTKETTMGLMQVLPKNAEWLNRLACLSYLESMHC